MKTYTREELDSLLSQEDLLLDATEKIERWLARGDGVAVYRNHDLGHPNLGHVQIVSYGSPDAQLEVDEPPTTLPDIGNAINWRYQLEGVYREKVTA